MRRCWLSLTLMMLLVLPVVAQRAPQLRPTPPNPHGAGGIWDTQLRQVDQLIRLDHLSRANAILEQLATSGAPVTEVRKRRIRIALAIGELERARELCREALAAEPEALDVWRHLASVEVADGQPDAARMALDRYLALAGDPRPSLAAAVDILGQGDLPRASLALIDSARTVLADPAFLARRRAVILLGLDQPREAAVEVRRDLDASPYNLPLLRRDLLGEAAPPLLPAFESELLDLADRDGARPELVILAANALVARGEPTRARDLVLPYLDRPNAARAALANAGVLTLELPVLPEGPERGAQVQYLLELLPLCGEHPGLSTRRRQQALDNLAAACVFALQHSLLDDDPDQAVERFSSLLDRVRQVHPESPQLYAAQIELARYTRERLDDPTAAASRLETMLLDLDLPLEGVALARLALGESYLAARDTSRARTVLTALGRDPEFRGPAGHAHFLLARLDLAQGYVTTARDRFAAVALDSPGAPYANDALELGLIMAEELQNPTGGPDLLARYVRSVWWQITAEPDSQRVALQKYIDRAAVQLDLEAPQPLLERARLELAQLDLAAGRLDHALAQLDRIVNDQPDGRLAPRALALRGEILADQRLDTAAARREYERLLAQYPDYLFAAEIRQRLRDLP